MDMWEQIGTFSKRGLIEEAILLDIIADQVLIAWDRAERAIIALRVKRGDSVYENFEYIAVRAKLWSKRHAGGTYPRNLPRMNDL